jgi:hypothetical protein
VPSRIDVVDCCRTAVRDSQLLSAAAHKTLGISATGKLTEGPILGERNNPGPGNTVLPPFARLAAPPQFRELISRGLSRPSLCLSEDPSMDPVPGIIHSPGLPCRRQRHRTFIAAHKTARLSSRINPVSGLRPHRHRIALRVPRSASKLPKIRNISRSERKPFPYTLGITGALSRVKTR